MQPERGIVSMYRRPEGIPMIPDYLKTPTFQSNGTNDAPRDPLHGPVTTENIEYIWDKGMQKRGNEGGGVSQMY